VSALGFLTCPIDSARLCLSCVIEVDGDSTKKTLLKAARAEPVEACGSNLRDAKGFVRNCTALRFDKLRANVSLQNFNLILAEL